MMSWNGHRYKVAPSEGGHADFAPQDDVEDAMLRMAAEEVRTRELRARLSGPGLVNLYRFLRSTGATARAGVAHGPHRRRRSRAGVSRGGARPRGCHLRRDPNAVRVASTAPRPATIALTALAVGGVFLGGGIAPKILPASRTDRSCERFAAKGRFAMRCGRFRCTSCWPRTWLCSAQPPASRERRDAKRVRSGGAVA